MRSINTRAGEIASERCIRVRSCEPKRIAKPRLGRSMSAKQIHLVLVILRDESLCPRRGHDGWKFTGIALELQPVVIVVEFHAHSQTNIGVAERLQRVDREDVA